MLNQNEAEQKNDIDKKLVCKSDCCVGCMACLEICPQGAIRIEDTARSYNAVIDENKCIDCGACYKLCQNNHFIVGQKPKIWKQGWAADNNIRNYSSSGGVAQALERAFIQSGGIVCSCSYSVGGFIFSCSAYYLFFRLLIQKKR